MQGINDRTSTTAKQFIYSVSYACSDFLSGWVSIEGYLPIPCLVSVVRNSQLASPTQHCVMGRVGQSSGPPIYVVPAFQSSSLRFYSVFQSEMAGISPASSWVSWSMCKTSPYRRNSIAKTEQRLQLSYICRIFQPSKLFSPFRWYNKSSRLSHMF